jgi:hypothetical protein
MITDCKAAAFFVVIKIKKEDNSMITSDLCTNSLIEISNSVLDAMTKFGGSSQF